ncbi:hypothetical protein BV898_03219 [Hypsibius exemplaris]|uniref:Uncharacterized protein n=1 Tax=Hypsibius exemplaris TaxID=2072580 RepID=A0A1W0X639_HYPEX|nr:hypothetical protein BV898_03219 [Hypsibius exemplaris]
MASSPIFGLVSWGVLLPLFFTGSCAASSFLRIGDPVMHCRACINDNEPCPWLNETQIVSCPRATEGCVRYSDNSFYKIDHYKGFNMRIDGGWRGCVDSLLRENKELFGIADLNQEQCYRNLNIKGLVKGAGSTTIPADATIEFKGDICICKGNGTGLCNGARKIVITLWMALSAVALSCFSSTI